MRVKKPPPPIHWHLLANAPGPDKIPFFSCRSAAKVPIVTEDREPTRAAMRLRARNHNRNSERDYGDIVYKADA